MRRRSNTSGSSISRSASQPDLHAFSRATEAARRAADLFRARGSAQRSQPTVTATASVYTERNADVASSSSSFGSHESNAVGGPKILRPELKCLEFCAQGSVTVRYLTRQQVLDEARGNTTGLGVDFVRYRRSPSSQRYLDDRSKGIASRTRTPPKRTRNGRGRAPLPSPPVAAMQRKNQFRNALTMRDMRQVDPDFTPKPALWVRQHALVVSLEQVRAIILYNKMFLFDPDNRDVQDFIKYLTRHLSSGSVEDAFMPFEFRALDAILVNACYRLERAFFDNIEPQIEQTLGQSPLKINTEQLEKLRFLEQTLNYFYARSRKVQHVLQAVLDEDEDMADMYLTEKNRNPERLRNPVNHDEAETLLETYLQTVDDLTSKAELLNRTIDDTEDLMEIHLDAMQNRLLLVDLIITAITTTLSFGSMVTGIFGMNLQLPHNMRHLPSSQYYFYGCVSLMVLIMAVGLLVLTRWCRRQGLYRGYSTLGKPTHVRTRIRGRRGRGSGVVQAAAEEVQRQARELHEKRRVSVSEYMAVQLRKKSTDGLPDAI